MLDKQLTEAAWKTFAKGKDYKDAALLKALAALQKAEKEGPQALLDALDALDGPVKQAKALRSAHKGDKELAAWLDKFDKALDGERAAAEKALAEAHQEGDDDDSPALLTTKLVVALRQVRNGEPAGALIALGGKKTAVLLSRKSIGSSQQKLLKAYLDGGTVKFVPGQCLFEANAHTFVVESQAAGLAKKLKQALLDQTEQRMKVRVRGIDPNDVDEDLDDDEAPAGGTPSDANAQEWQRRAAEIEPLVLQALKNSQLDVSRIRAVWGFAQQKAESGDAAAALKTLGVLLPLLRGTATGGGSPPPGGGNPQLETALQAWRTQRDGVVNLLRDLSRQIAEAKAPDADKAFIEISAVFKQLKGDPSTTQQVQEMETWLRDDEVVADVCELEEDVRKPLLDALQGIRQALASAG